MSVDYLLYLHVLFVLWTPLWALQGWHNTPKMFVTKTELFDLICVWWNLINVKNYDKL